MSPSEKPIVDQPESDFHRAMRLQAERREKQFEEEEAARRWHAEQQEKEKEKYGSVLPPGSRLTSTVIPSRSGYHTMTSTLTKKKSKIRLYNDNPSKRALAKDPNAHSSTCRFLF